MINAHPHHVALAVALLAGGAPLATAQPVQTLTVNAAVQVAAEAPALRVYFDALDAVGDEVPDLRPEELSATLGEAAVEVRRLDPFAETGEGVAYVFVVDTSMSLSAGAVRPHPRRPRRSGSPASAPPIAPRSSPSGRRSGWSPTSPPTASSSPPGSPPSGPPTPRPCSSVGCSRRSISASGATPICPTGGRRWCSPTASTKAAA